MGEWPLVRLGDLVRVEHGWAFPGIGFVEPSGGFPRIVNIGDFALPYASQLKPETMREFAGQFPPKFELSPGDILLAMTCQTRGGEVLGIPMRVPNDGRTYLHNQRLGKIVVCRPDLVDEHYLYFVFLSKPFNDYLTRTASGSAILHTAPDRIESYNFSLPPLPEQRAIAEVLGALDDKIEANRRVEVAVWRLAKAQFDVLAAEPNEFVPLGSVLSLAYGKSLTAELRLPGTTPVYGSGGVVGWHNTPLASGPGVIVGRKGTAGAVHWCQTDFFAIDTTFYVEKPAVPMLFAYFLLRSLGLAHMNSDSAVPGLNRNAALRRLVPLPDEKSLAEFSWSVEPLIKAAGFTQREGRILTDLRDSLLPKLLSGELRVREAGSLVGEAV